MKKYIGNFMQSSYGILLIIAVIICLATWFYMVFTSPKDIQYRYDGIKYQAGNLESSEPIKIEIIGKYSKELFTGNVKFEGTIKVGEKIFTDRTIRFNKYKMGSLESKEGHFGMIFIGDMFKLVTIEIHEPNQNGGYSWNSENGWMISAPCGDRKEAVIISNILTRKLNKYSLIK